MTSISIPKHTLSLSFSLTHHLGNVLACSRSLGISELLVVIKHFQRGSAETVQSHRFPLQSSRGVYLSLSNFLWFYKLLFVLQCWTQLSSITAPDPWCSATHQQYSCWQDIYRKMGTMHPLRYGTEDENGASVDSDFPWSYATEWQTMKESTKEETVRRRTQIVVKMEVQNFKQFFSNREKKPSESECLNAQNVWSFCVQWISCSGLWTETILKKK